MARNKLSDLNNHLFEQLERLNDEELSNEDLEKEIKRQRSMSEVATNIIEINRISMDAIKLIAKGDISINELPSEIDTIKPKQIGN
jgi:benzoyl-CoA reductase/2-hydroxyglutaryl-CoA dehydratase subunit BcrC/BadD/HgdB